MTAPKFYEGESVGLRLPIFGYINGWDVVCSLATDLKREPEESEVGDLIATLRAEMNSAIDCIQSQNATLASKYLYSSRNSNPKACDWMPSCTVEDEKLDDGSALLHLIKKMGSQGTIIAPHLGHVMTGISKGRKRATARIVELPIAVIAMRGEGMSLKQELDRFNYDVDGAMSWLTTEAIRNRISMSGHINGSKRKKRPFNSRIMKNIWTDTS